MAKQINVDLRFNADTNAAKRSINQLAKALDELTRPHKIEGISADQLNKAAQAAKELQGHLQNAVNVNTGKIDLSKFSQSLSRSNTDIQSLALNLSRAGTQGQQAFANLVKNMNMADKSMIGLGEKMNSFATTLKNTARWQISSSILHGFMGTISSALGYAERLNTSLNNIRIVTGQSVDQMAAFAEKANAAAKALSTTTTAYTDAALIYYQQGLSGKAVEERAETTLKLANVSRQSAETVSQQMTGIWNNFDDGSKSLEYYADVLTKLGATTASSTQEIATGLEKFAAIADTVGLSYEHAAAALATITATTRQSADVVGTALKTLFARIQDLEVGKTLEDGTTLGKYSQALAAIGVQIKDANGEVRSMDSILDDMGGKWDTLSKDMQIAVAQTVAGTRQYTQLMALMDNWDFMQENLATARGAEGELQKQADIYAESWEAAQKRVRASAESLYSDLLNDKFFIGMNNGLAGFLDLLDNVIDGFGGLKTIIMGVASIFISKFAKEIPAALNSVKQGLSVINGQANENQKKMFEQVNTVAKGMMTSSSYEMQAMGRGMALTSEMSLRLTQNLSSLTKAERAEAQAKIAQVQAAQDYATSLGREIDLLGKQQAVEKSALASSQSLYDSKLALRNERDILIALREEAQQKLQSQLHQQSKATTTAGKAQYDDMIKKTQADIDLATNSIKELDAAWVKLQADFKGNNKLLGETEKLNEQIGKMEGAFTNTQGKIDGYIDSLKQLKSAEQSVVESEAKMAQSEISEALTKLQEQVPSAAEGLEKLKGVIASMPMTAEGAPGFLANLNFELKQLEEQSKLDEGSIAKLEERLAELRGQYLQQNPGQEGAYANFEQRARQKGQMMYSLNNLPVDANLENFAKHYVKTSEIIGKLGSQLMNLGMAISAVKELGSIWSNDDISMGDKMVQSLSSVSMILISTAPLLKTFGTHFRDIAAAGSLAFGELKRGAAGIKTLFETMGSSIAKFLTGPIGITLMLAAGIAAIVSAVKQVQKDMYEASLEGQLEKANEKANEFKNALEDVNAASQTLQSSWDRYNSAVSTLNACTEGTQEWLDALVEVNSAVADLVELFPSLKGYVYLGSNGELLISKEGYDEVASQTKRYTAAAMSSYQQAFNDTQQKQLAIDRNELQSRIANETINSAYNWRTGLNDKEEKFDSAQAAALMQIGSKAFEDGFDFNERVKVESNRDYYNARLAGEVGGGTGRSNEIFQVQLDPKFVEKVDPVLKASLKETEAQQELLDEQLADIRHNALTSAGADSRELQDRTGKAVVNALQPQFNAQTDELKNENKALLNSNTQEAHQAALEAIRSSIAPGAKEIQDISGGQVRYTDKNGDTQYQNVEVISELMAEYEAMTDAISKAEELTPLIRRMPQQGTTSQTAAGNALLNQILNGDLSSVTRTDKTELARLSDSALEDLLNSAAGGAEALDQMAAAAGTNREELLKNIKEGVSFQDTKDDVQSKAQQSVAQFEQTDGILSLRKSLGDISDDAANQFIDNLSKISSSRGGAEAAKAYADIIGNALSQLEVDDATRDRIANQLLNIDLNDVDAYQQIVDTFNMFGVNVDDANGNLQSLISTIQSGLNIFGSLNAILGNTGNALQTLQNVSFGSILDSNMVSTLTQYSSEFSDLMLTVGDSTYFIGNASYASDAMVKSYEAQLGYLSQLKSEVIDYQNSAAKNGKEVFDTTITDSKSQLQELQRIAKEGDISDTLLARAGTTREEIEGLSGDLERANIIYQDLATNMSMAKTELMDAQQQMVNAAIQTHNMDALNATFIPEDMTGTSISEDTYSKSAGIMAAIAEDISQANDVLSDFKLNLSEIPTAALDALGERFTSLSDEISTLEAARARALDINGMEDYSSNVSSLINSDNDQLKAAAADGENLLTERTEEQKQAALDAADANLRLASSAAVLAESTDESASQIEYLMEQLAKENDMIDETTGTIDRDMLPQLEVMASRYIKCTNGVAKLRADISKSTTAFNSFKDSLTKGNKAAAIYTDGLENVHDAVADIVGVSKDALKYDFLGRLSKEDIAGAAQGSAEAINNIRAEYAAFAAEAAGINEEVANGLAEAMKAAGAGGEIDLGIVDAFMTELNQTLDLTSMTMNEVAALVERDYGVHIDWDGEDVITGLNATQAAALAAQGYLVGVAEAASTDVEVKQQEVSSTNSEEITDLEAVDSPGIGHADELVPSGSITASGGFSLAPLGEEGGTSTASGSVTFSGGMRLKPVARSYRIPGYKINPQSDEVQNEKTETFNAVKVKSGKTGDAGHGGNIKAPSGGGRRGGGGRRCFVAGTLVSTLYGYIPIEQLKVGDTVLSYNEKLQKNEYNQVLQIMIHDTIELFYTIYVENETITATGTHPFYIVRNGIGQWIELEKVYINDLVMFADGSLHKIIDINIDLKAKRVYNLEVSGNHNYYVGLNQILVHNKGGRRRGGGGGRTSNVSVSQRATISKDDKERYHVVGKSLEGVSHRYNMLAKAREKTFGNQYVKNLEKELKLMKEQIDLQKQYVSENRRWINTDKQNMITGQLKQWTEKNKNGSEILMTGYMGGLANLYNVNSKAKAAFDKRGLGSILEFKDGYLTEKSGNRLQAALSANSSKDMLKIANEIFGLNSDGVITTWDELEDIQIENLKNKQMKYNETVKALEKEGVSEERAKELEWQKTLAEEALARAELEYKTYQDLQKQFEESVQKAKELKEAMVDMFDEMQSKVFEIIQKKLENRVKIVEREQGLIELSMKRMEDNWTKTAEVMNLQFQPWQDEFNSNNNIYGLIRTMVFNRANPEDENDIWGNNAIISKLWSEGSKEYEQGIKALGVLNTVLSTQDQKKIDETKLLEDAGLSQSQYVQILDQIFDEYSGSAEELIELNNNMKGYYKSALDGALNDLKTFIDQMTHSKEVNEYYKNLTGLLGKNFIQYLRNEDGQFKRNRSGERIQNNNSNYDYYGYMQNIYNIQDALLKNDVITAQQEYESWKAMLDEQEEYVKTLGGEEARIYRENVIEPTRQAAFDAQNRVFDALAERIDNAKEKAELAITEIFEKLEDNATNSLGWDILSQGIDLSTDHANNYLTTTQKIYETTSLINKVTADRDKTENQAAKLRLNNFQRDIEAMSKKERLTQHEMETAKARYEILLAQIALEEAQNAKSTVRLQRDSEGNYGYVYTADQEDVDDAAQQLLDANNNLYELEKGFEEEALQRLIQLRQDYANAMQELEMAFLNNEITQEQYQERSEELKAKYEENLYDAQAKYLFARAILEDEFSDQNIDRWTNEYQWISNTLDTTIDEIENATDKSNAAIEEFDQVRQDVYENSMANLQDLEKETANLKQKNDELRDSLNKTIPVTNELMKQVDATTRAWLAEYDAIQKVITALTKYMQIINNTENELNTEYDDNINYAAEIEKILASNGYDFSDARVQELLSKRAAKVAQTGGTSNTEYISNFLSNYIYRNGLDSTDWKNGNGIVTNIAAGLQTEYGKKGERKETQDLINQGYENAWGTGYDNEEPFTFERSNVAKDVQEHFNNDYSAAVNQFFDWASKSSGIKWDAGMVKAFGELNPNLISKIAGRNDKIAKDAAIAAKYPVKSIEDMLRSAGAYLEDQSSQNWSNAIAWAMGWLEKEAAVAAGYGHKGGRAWTAEEFLANPFLAYMWGQRATKAKDQDLVEWLKLYEKGDIQYKKEYSMDTGGFTGTWGPEGKFALLHEKELVLNKKDTENILDAVAMIRELSNAIDLRALSAAIGGGIYTPAIGSNSQVIEQQVTIQAEFPNATNHNEIEQAFTTLINRATQYAGIPLD